MKKSSIVITILLILELFLTPIISYSAFYDTNYPPNSSGRTDYTDQEADKEKEEEKSHTSDEYVGKSSNNYLESLTVENATMEPAFHRQYVDYELKLENEENKKINIVAKAEDEKAKVEGAGEIELQPGMNHIRIVVTAENGNVQIYNLKIELPFEQSDLTLESLEIEGVNIETGKNEKVKLNPDFDKTVYKYAMEVPYQITSLFIQATSAQNTYLSITGDNDLEIGKNKVVIKVIDEQDETKSTTYVIEVERKEEKEPIKWEAIIIVMVFIFIVITIGFLIGRKRK